MYKLILFSLLVFVISIVSLRYNLMEQWTNKDRFWEPDGSNLMQNRLDTLDTMGRIAMLGCLVAIIIPIIGYFGFFRGKEK